MTADTVWPRDRDGLDGFNGEVGRARYEGWPFSGDARKGE